ncbi:MAG: GGDEF domain-containing protein [Gammaproteobacteria bacterium]|nr:GGDEF domain-containing protein [Gammaproteobacteria bacterium]
MGINSINPRLLLNFGLFSQLVAAVLLVVLFLLLRRHAVRRPYFRAWSSAWVALAIGLAALTLRYNLLPLLTVEGTGTDWWAKGSNFVYQFGKLAFALLLLHGTLLYLKGVAHPPLSVMRWLWAGVGAVALASVVASSNLQSILFWQGLCNLLVFVFCAVAMLTLPKSRRSLGTRTTGSVLAATSLLWLAYLLALVNAVVPGIHATANLGALLNGPNNYLDLILDMLLAFGMVLVLFEDLRREIDTAHRELHVAHEQLLRESYVDALTGAYNRRAFSEGTGLEDAKGSFGVLVALDVDNLKDVNDAYGHKHGDALLRHLSSVLRAGLRPSDKLYRMGGDEFLVVMPRAVVSTAAARIREIIANAPSLRLADSDTSLELRASVGAAEFTSIEQLDITLHAADRSMYDQKRASHQQHPVLPGAVRLENGH